MRDPEASVLVLGGTAEAASLARALEERFGSRLRVVTSLAGLTLAPAKIPGAVRSGGFGGAEGLAAYLRDERIGLLVDATHPFATAIARHARLAAEAVEVPRIVLDRPAWVPEPGDRWIEAEDIGAAARAALRAGRSALVTTGARGLEAFAACVGMALVVRLMAAPREPVPIPRAQIVIALPPFTLDDERLLLHRHAIDVLVAKASGGAVPAKLVAAREAGIPVILVKRPEREPGTKAVSVTDAAQWVATRLGA
jgi:precorrin-6A/cobalt-precorrin-6A reductase